MADQLFLDTNALVVLREVNHPVARRVLAWLANGGKVTVCAMVWHEFLCGPLTPDELAMAEGLVGSAVQSIEGAEAKLGATLYNASGRRRGTHADCLIAAAAIRADAPLLTLNTADFAKFETLGLKLVAP